MGDPKLASDTIVYSFQPTIVVSAHNHRLLLYDNGLTAKKTPAIAPLAERQS